MIFFTITQLCYYNFRRYKSCGLGIVLKMSFCELKWTEHRKGNKLNCVNCVLNTLSQYLKFIETQYSIIEYGKIPCNFEMLLGSGSLICFRKIYSFCVNHKHDLLACVARDSRLAISWFCVDTLGRTDAVLDLILVILIIY